VLYAFRSVNLNSSDLPTGVKFVRDKTSLERKTLRACHQEIDRRTQNGEADLTISYINGVPCVTKSRSKNFKLNHQRTQMYP